MIIGISGKIGVGKDTVGNMINYCIHLTELLKENREWEKEYNSSPFTEEDFNQWLEAGYTNLDSHFEIKKFADKLKDIVCLLLNCTREQLENREFKEKELGEEWWRYRLKVPHMNLDRNNKTIIPLLFNSETEAWEYNKTLGYSIKVCEVFVEKLTPRKLLQLIGTECGRNIIHPNIWVNALMSEYVCSCGHRIPNEDGIEHVEFDTCKEPNWIITDVRFPNELKAVKDRGGISIRVNRNTCGCTVQEAQDCMKHCTKSTYQHPSETALDDAKFDYTIDNNFDILELIYKVKVILKKEKLL